jgi:hypothetical protein
MSAGQVSLQLEYSSRQVLGQCPTFKPTDSDRCTILKNKIKEKFIGYPNNCKLPKVKEDRKHVEDFVEQGVGALPLLTLHHMEGEQVTYSRYRCDYVEQGAGALLLLTLHHMEGEQVTYSRYRCDFVEQGVDALPLLTLHHMEGEQVT